MKLVIVQGKTSSGKTTLARRLAKDLDMATFFKDDYKESQYDALGKVPSLKEWVDIENDSWEQLNDAVASAIRNRTSLIIEGNFVPKQRKRLRELIPTNSAVVEIYCSARGRVLFRRYVRRNQTGERHKGHRDHLWYWVVFSEMVAAHLGFHWIQPIRISGNILEVDTTDFSKVDYQKIRRFVERSA